MLTKKRATVFVAVLGLAGMGAFIALRANKPRTVVQPSMEHQVTMLTLLHADNWPGIPMAEKSEILSLLKDGKDSDALERTRKAVYDGVSRQMIQGGYNVAKENRWGWDQNNRATTLIFIDFPLAQRLGQTDQMVNEYQVRGGWRSIMENLSNEQRQKFMDYFSGGKWPFDGEQAPIYKPQT
jgi:hypothetical protein